jgi:hypothetical protein
MPRKELRYWKIPVSALLDQMLEEAIRRGVSVSKADFIRVAVIERLERLGLTEHGALDQAAKPKGPLIAVEKADQGEG